MASDLEALEWAHRHPIATWALAWGMAGVGFLAADVFSSPRRGPLWVAVVSGLIGWSIAGSLTLHRTHRVRGAVVWAVAYAVAFWLAALWGASLERAGSAGFVGALLGWAVGGAVGALVSDDVAASKRALGPRLFSSAAWGLSFLLGGYVAMVTAMLLGQVAGRGLEFLGEGLALTLGWGAGASLGGAVASAIGMAVRNATAADREKRRL